jgi:YidC/Oxa1 family membrane protein insertase
MDKKSLLGFAVLIIILLAWFPIWNFFFPPPARTISPADTTTAQTQVPGDTLAKADTSGMMQSPTMAPLDSASMAALISEPEKLITIDTKNIKVVMSSYGGNVKQVVLKHYLDHNAEQVRLLDGHKNPEWARYGALSIGYIDKPAAFNGYSFKTDAQDVILNNHDSTVSVVFTFNSPDGATVTKKYTFHYQDYLFDLDIKVTNPDKLDLRQGITVGWFAPLEPTENDISQDKGKLGGYFSMGGEYDYFNKIKDGKLKQSVTGPIDWVASKTKYFAAVVMAAKDPGQEVVVVGANNNRTDAASKIQQWDIYGVGMTYNNPGREAALSFKVYTGPLDYDKLHGMGQGLSSLVDMGWKFFRPFAIAILWFFTNLHKLIPNYGFVIIVFSIIMKVIFWPLSLKSGKSMYKMKEIQPKLQEIKEKYKNDPGKLNTETMKAYKEFGVNPFGSCLPMLIQLPIFWALYAVLSNTIELRGAAFILGITDLSQPDPSSHFMPLGIGIMAIIMGIAMFFQQKMTVTDPKQKMLVYIMPIMFTYLFSRWASGLVLYWTMFSVIGILEQWMVQRHIQAEKESQKYAV